MTMPIVALMQNEGEAIYYTPEFRAMLESHMAWLRARPELTLTPIDPHAAMKYAGDLDGLLTYYNVEPRYHWFIMRLNNLTSSQEYTADRLSLYFLTPSYVELLHTRSKVVTKKVA